VTVPKARLTAFIERDYRRLGIEFKPPSENRTYQDLGGASGNFADTAAARLRAENSRHWVNCDACYFQSLWQFGILSVLHSEFYSRMVKLPRVTVG
jgi:hypothetical protein